MAKTVIIILWGILLFIASISMYVFIHESVHAIRIDLPQMMCIGLSEEYFGMVIHNNFYSDSVIFKEEVIANVIAGIVVLLFIFLSYYLLFQKDNN